VRPVLKKVVAKAPVAKKAVAAKATPARRRPLPRAQERRRVEAGGQEEDGARRNECLGVLVAAARGRLGEDRPKAFVSPRRAPPAGEHAAAADESGWIDAVVVSPT